MGKFPFQPLLPETDSETTTKSEKHVVEAMDKLDSEDNCAQGKQHMFSEIDTDTNLIKSKVLNHR